MVPGRLALAPTRDTRRASPDGTSMQIIPELIPTAILTVPFAVTLLALWFILFKPLLDYLEEREGVSTRALAEADHIRHSTASRMAEIEGRLAAARKSATELRQDARARAQKQEIAIVRAARVEADERVDAAVAAIGQSRTSASTVLRNQASDLARDLARQVLGREI